VKPCEARDPREKFRGMNRAHDYQFNGTDSASARFPADHGETVSIAR
jgi:hypothetical protein